MQDVASSIDRYQVVRRTGAGGMGVVYEAEDLERGQKVALKTIANPDVEKIYQLKREFRVLADLSHPNLVALYDLVVVDSSCFFTMELLDGEDLLAWLWNTRPPDHDTDLGLAQTTAGSDPALATGSGITDLDRPAREPAVPGSTPCDLDRLRAALPQLA